MLPVLSFFYSLPAFGSAVVLFHVPIMCILCKDGTFLPLPAGLHGYTLNERLFTEPLNADDEGKSMCPVCLTSREHPTKQSPGFVR